MLASRADLHHTDSITPLGPVSRQAVRAVFSEGQDGLVNDFDGLSDFILLDDEGRRQADDVAVRGLGQQPVVAEAQTHLPGIVICKGREGQHQQGTEGTPSTAEEVSHLQHGLLFASWQMRDAHKGHPEQLCMVALLFVSAHRVLLLHSPLLVWHSDFKINVKRGTV